MEAIKRLYVTVVTTSGECGMGEDNAIQAEKSSHKLYAVFHEQPAANN